VHRAARHRPRALLLDALGTLLALEPPAPRLRAELAERFGVSVSLEQAASAVAAEIAYYRSRLHEGRDAGTLGALRRDCAETLRSALPAGPELARVPTASLVQALLGSLRFSAYPDAAPALLAARARGERLVVVSNWDASLRYVLERAGLAARVDGVVTAADVGVAKPAPDAFEAALTLAGVTADEATHVGDSVEEDVGGARGAGLEPVLLRRDGGPGPAGVRTIASLEELP
jgi:putative hydrolase of the HAD superfamily